MNGYGTQIKLYGTTLLQFSHVNSKSSKLPTLAIEMTNSDNAWDQSCTIKMQLTPEDELMKLCIYLHPESGKDKRGGELKIQRNQNLPKVLTIRHNDNGTYFVGLFDNTKNISHSRVLGPQQILTLRMMAFSQLASLYKCTIADLVLMLGLHIKS